MVGTFLDISAPPSLFITISTSSPSFLLPVIMTRSRTKSGRGDIPGKLKLGADVSLFCAVPMEFTSIPFPVKALKILIREILSNGESATIPHTDPSVDDDDGVSFFSLSSPLLLY